MNSGAPSDPVNIEMGISEPVIVRASVSTMSMNAAPDMIDAGTTYRLSGPRSRRQKCGMIRPAQPMVPEMQVAIAVRNVELRMSSPRMSLTFIPRKKASFSPSASSPRFPTPISLLNSASAQEP